ncbi:MAG: FAD-dependent oxidoreductase [Prevotellaceae bacterium]|nr:FAD-dependent oxidoreductase [Prevotellaceae bacterium]
MTALTVFIYHFFRRHKTVFYVTLLASAACFAFFGWKITFEEDITKLLPSVEQEGAEKLVFSNLKVKDKLFFLFTSASGGVEPEGLITACDGFVQTLLEKDSAHHVINNILYEVDESLLQDGIAFLYEHAPAFLDSSQYRRIDSLLAYVDSQMQENYTLLTSAAGMAYKEIIAQDPIALRKLFLAHAGSIGNGLGGNYAFYENHIFTADTSALVAFLSPNFKSFDSKQNTLLINLVTEEVEAFRQQHPEITLHYHGAPARSVFNSKRIKMDLLLTVSISLLLTLALLLICFRNKSTLFYLVVPVVYGVFFALSLIYFIKGSMSLMAIGIGAVVMGVAFSYCLHIITHYKYVSDPEQVLKDQTVPVILGVLTTIGAFMGLLFTESELLSDFGLFASLGLVGTTLFALLFLPQLFNPRSNKKSEKAFALLDKINAYPLEKQKWLIAAILAVSVVCFITSEKVKFDSDLQNIGYHDQQVLQSEQLLASKTADSLSTVYFAAVAKDVDAALASSVRLCARLDTLAASGLIKSYAAPSSLFIPAAEQQQRIARWKSYWTNEKKAAARQKITEAGNRHKFLPGTFDPFFALLDADYAPASLYDAEVIPPELMDNIIEHTGDSYLVFIPVRMERKQLMEAGSRVVTGQPGFVVVDPMYYTSDMVKTIHSDFNITLAISSLFVLVVLLVSLRNILLALLAFLPMGLSWYIVLGSMSIFGLEFNLINIIISSFIFGIGVDYSIFIMDGLLAKHRKGTPLLAYHKTAIFFSAVILIVVVASLLFAVHPAISSIGIATLIGMGATILMSYSLQPFLFSLLIKRYSFKGKRMENGLEPQEAFSIFNPPLSIKKKYDVIIIGSGLGGLECGYILARKGYSVCVLEQNPQIGGCLQTFRRGGAVFDTGFHYVGGLDEGQFLHKLFRYFDLLDLPWRRLDENGFAEIVLHGKSYFFASGYQRFVETLAGEFPHQRKQLANYAAFLKQVGDNISRSFLPGDDHAFSAGSLFGRSAWRFLQETVDDPLLRQVLSGASLTMELCAEKLPLYVFAQINNSFIQSAWRLDGGGSLIAEKLAGGIRQMGGTVLTKTKVTRLITKDNRIAAVEYNGEEQLQSRYVISDAHPALTLALLGEPSPLRKAYRNRINSLPNTYGMFTTHLQLKENTIPYLNRTVYLYKEQDVWNYCRYRPGAKTTAALVNCQTPRHGETCTTNIDILTPMHWEEVAQWSEGAQAGHRDEAYRQFKERKAEECIALAAEKIPGLKQAIEKIYTSTPLTYRDYTGTWNGSAYGIRKDYTNTLQTILPPQTPIPNLLLTGQNLNLHGVLGVSMTSFFTCAKIVGMEKLVSEL